MVETILTPEGKEKITKELKTLKDKRKGIIEKISRAKEMGDLSENAEYHSARDDQSFNEGKIRELEVTLVDARIVAKTTGNSIIALGSSVTLERDGNDITYHIVGSHEAMLIEKKISIDSPIAKALLGKKSGDTVPVNAPAGTILYTIKKINSPITKNIK